MIFTSEDLTAKYGFHKFPPCLHIFIHLRNHQCNVNFQNKHPNIDMESYWFEYPTDGCLILQDIASYGINPCHIFHHISTRDNLTHYLQGGLVIPGRLGVDPKFRLKKTWKSAAFFMDLCRPIQQQLVDSESSF